VGTYENLRTSLATLAVLRGTDVSSTAYKSNVAHAFSYDGGEDDAKVCLPNRCGVQCLGRLRDLHCTSLLELHAEESLRGKPCCRTSWTPSCQRRLRR
jgi:hypothetical protein